MNCVAKRLAIISVYENVDAVGLLKSGTLFLKASRKGWRWNLRNFLGWCLIAFLAGPCVFAQLPAGWSDTDIGSPAFAGSASQTNGLWIVAGGGTDIWETNDQFNFVSDGLISDGSIIALVTSLENTDPDTGWSKAGVMFRNDETAGAVNAMMTATAGEGVAFQYRDVSNSDFAIIQIPAISAPVWVQVNRSGDQFSGYYSLDGTNWVLVGYPVRIKMSGTALAGLAVTAHNNSALNTATFTNVSLSTSVFGVYRELWTNLTSTPSYTLDVLTNTTDNPDWPTNPAPFYTHIFTNFETESDSPLNGFGQRLRTFVIPPTTGFYTFWISSDDTSELFLSPDESPADMLPIASVPFSTSPEDWTVYPSQQSVPIFLQAGCRYYLEANVEHTDGESDGNLAVGWELPDYTFEEPMAGISAAGTLLIPCNGVDTPPGIYTQSSNVTVVENRDASFSVVVTNQSAVTYQWFDNAAVVPGANLAAYTMSNVSLALSNNNVLTCVISNSAGSITSVPISLSVLPDTAPPTVVQVFDVALSNVDVVFSKPVALAVATNVANYAFTNGMTISGATLAADNVTVSLTTLPLANGSNYTLVINNISDLATTPNVIASNTTVSFTASSFVSEDIGAPAISSATILTTNGLNVSGAGNYIGGYSDQFNFQYQLQSGDFDISVCLAGLGLSDLWAEAGLMARASLDPAAPFAATIATPGMNGEFFTDRSSTNTAASTAGNFPVNYPNTWLRLSRTGSNFMGFGSYDGTNWTQLGTATIPMTDQIYVGLAVASHNTNLITTAQFVNYGPTSTNAVVATVVNPHEAIGPSSRKTGIVFSEIMYKPAPRSDTNNVEFLEIYNSNPFFQDISGYTVTCADMNYTFPSNTLIPGGACFVLAASPQSMANVYGITSNIYGPYTGSLKKSETLELLDEQSNILLTVPYSATYPWPVAALGAGHSIVLANPTYGEGDPRAWDISDSIGGSPGQVDPFTPSPLRNVVINEILPHSENPAVPQFIELYNHGTKSVDVSGCVLTDNPATNEFVIPVGTVIGPAGFIAFNQSQFGFTLNGAGETLYLINPGHTRILDAVQFGGQSDGVSYGRWPDGANDFYAFTANTPGTNNSTIWIGDIVINELMYDPISGSDDDQYIELYNQGTNTVNMSGWEFTAGVTFTFPADTTIGPNSYLVVARNMTNLFSKYTNLNTGNTVGNYTGKLSHNGELVALAMPQTLYETNVIYVEQDEVTYGTGGRWGQWSSGGGSSLELIDPHSNHRLAANWADSDETQKSQWTDIESTSVLTNGANYDPSIDYAQIGILDAGECLVDNIEVDYNGTNYVSNPGFDEGFGLTNWTCQGCMVRSSLENSGYQSDYSLHIRSSDRFWTGDNSCEVSLANTTLQPGQTVTLRFKARWLHGWPEALLRLNGNWLEAAGAMQVPANLGSPGMPNSSYITNAGPAIYNVTHTPSLPGANQAAIVTAQVHDPDGVTNLTLYYRIDPDTNYTAVPMVDDGTGGDAIAGDGVFSATIPGQSANTVVAFYIEAADSLGAATMFPALRNNNEPVRECVVMFGDSSPGGSFGDYHLWLTQSNIARWSSLGDLSNEGIDCTFVNSSRVMYNMDGWFTGSPFHQSYDSPVGFLCHYRLEFNADDQFLGATDFDKIHQTGNPAGSDSSLQREQLANTFLRALGVPWMYKRYVAVYVNGNRRGTLMEDTQVPNGDVVKEHFPNDDDGFLYKMQPWFEFAPFLVSFQMPFDNQSWCTLNPYTTAGNVNDVSRYRYNYEIRRTPDSDSDFTNVFSLVDAANSYGSPNYVANMESLANMENWMRKFAATQAAGDWDSFGSENGQNVYAYVGAEGTKFTLLNWEFNTVFGNNDSWFPGQGLFTVNPQDPNLQNIFATPEFLRMYWRAMEELVNGPLNVANSGPLLDAKLAAFTDNGIAVENPDTYIKPWLTEAQQSIAAQLASVNASDFSINPGVTLSNNVAYVTGQAPVNVDTVWINGVPYPLTWTSLTNWLIAVPLAPGTNQLNIQGVSINGQAIAGDSGTINTTNETPTVSPAGQVVINEIMYNPAVTNAQYIELYNNSTNYTFNLSGWQLQGVGYTFPEGAEIGPNQFLVLAADDLAFAADYGATNPVFDEFSGALQPPQLLALLDANSNTVAEVFYESVPPWPSAPNGGGAALELIDPTQDNWREGNWAGVSLSPDTTNTVYASLPPFPPLWINEVQPLNINGITNSAGQNAPWLELYNPTTNSVSLAGLFLANSYTNLTNWIFPAGSSLAATQFLIVFCDGQTNLSTQSELHASFTLSAGSGSLALSRLYNGQPHVLDYLDYTNLPPNYSYGSFPDGQSFVRQPFFYATPGSANNGSLASVVPYLALNSVYNQDFDSLPDPGSTTVDSASPVTINGVTYTPSNPLNFSASVANGGLGLATTMPGWFGLAADTMKVGASAGDQSTGGIISFGTTDTNSTNRALGLLATSSTGATAFGLCLVNLTTNTINEFTLNFTGELWRQQPSAKTLSFSYYIDPMGTNPFTVASTVPIPAMDVGFPVGTFSPEDGLLTTNEVLLAVTNQPILDWAPGAALWLVWQMTNSAGTSQGLGIDNLSFSADSGQVPPIILAQPQSQTNFTGSGATLSVQAAGDSTLSYQWQFDGTNIAGATNSSLVLAGLTSANAGSYDVVVSDATGTNVSQSAFLGIVSHTLVPYTNVGALYTQNFDSLPDPGSNTVDTANPAVINGVTYALPDPVDFGFPVQSSGTNGGLGLAATMPGWYGYGSVDVKLGASAGDQTTGGIISFGGTNNSATNRSLGLLATSTSGSTAFGVGIRNETANTLNSINLSFTGELWRQQTTAKSLTFLYYVDPAGTNGFVPANATIPITNLNVNFSTGSKNAGGTAPLKSAAIGITNQPITNCPPGGVLWLTWQMTSATSSAQGLAIDNLSFSATGPQTVVPTLNITQFNAYVMLSWQANITNYTLQSSMNLLDPNSWQAVAAANSNNTVIIPITNQYQYFRLAQ